MIIHLYFGLMRDSRLCYCATGDSREFTPAIIIFPLQASETSNFLDLRYFLSIRDVSARGSVKWEWSQEPWSP